MAATQWCNYCNMYGIESPYQSLINEKEYIKLLQVLGCIIECNCGKIAYCNICTIAIREGYLANHIFKCLDNERNTYVRHGKEIFVGIWEKNRGSFYMSKMDIFSKIPQLLCVSGIGTNFLKGFNHELYQRNIILHMLSVLSKMNVYCLICGNYYDSMPSMTFVIKHVQRCIVNLFECDL